MKHVRRPCVPCPWRRDAEPGRFTPERWEALRATSPDETTGFGPEYGAPLFACHVSPEDAEKACAGWLAVEGGAHPTVRMAAMLGHLPPDMLQAKDDWPELHESFADTAAHDLRIDRTPVDGSGETADPADLPTTTEAVNA